MAQVSETKLPDYGVPPESFTSELWEECKRYLEFDGADIGRL